MSLELGERGGGEEYGEKKRREEEEEGARGKGSRDRGWTKAYKTDSNRKTPKVIRKRTVNIKDGRDGWKI